METFVDFLDWGEYRNHYHVSHSGVNRYAKNLPTYEIKTMRQEKDAICPRCKAVSRQLKFYYGVNVLEAELPGTEISIRLLHTLPLFQCPNCPDSTFNPRREHVNEKAAFKRYLAGPGRLQAFWEELEQRSANVFQIGEGYISLNGAIEHHHEMKVPVGLQGIRWLDSEAKEVPLDMGRLAHYGAPLGPLLAGRSGSSKTGGDPVPLPFGGRYKVPCHIDPLFDGRVSPVQGTGRGRNRGLLCERPPAQRDWAALWTNSGGGPASALGVAKQRHQVPCYACSCG